MDLLNENELKLNIRDQAFAQAEAYARLTKKAFGSHYEIGFYLVGSEDGCIVEEVTLPPTQSVTHTSIKIDGSAVIQVGRALESQRKKSLGWCHSHADFTPFQSSIDHENTEDILRQISESNPTYIDRELTLSECNPPDSILRFMDGTDMVEIDLGNAEIAEKIRASGVQARRKLKVGKAFSLVVNALGDKPHAEVYVRRWCPECETEHISPHPANVNILSSVMIDEQNTMDEIKEKVFLQTSHLNKSFQPLPEKPLLKTPPSLFPQPGLFTHIVDHLMILCGLKEMGPEEPSLFTSEKFSNDGHPIELVMIGKEVDYHERT